MKKKRVICAMSGGVDSSVAAAFLKKRGYDVIGIFMKLWAEDTGQKKENICCSREASTAARKVCQKLDIPFYIVNFAEEFKKAVVDYYIKEYEEGRTPNPCVICNRDIKGQILMKKALEIGGDFLATGHYVRIIKKGNRYHLLQSVDKIKDQTYFLWTLTQKNLAKMLFPVGSFTKLQVREMAQKWHLPTAERKESQGICFIPDRDVSGFLNRYAKKLTKKGAICDINNKKIGIHNGLINYTIGQRERLGLGGPKSYYVVELKVEENILIVGDEKDLYKKKLLATDLNWINKPSKNIGARIRYGHPIEECKITKIDRGKTTVTFQKSQRAVTPGQSIVFYNQEEVLGGGFIAKNT